MKLSDNHKMPGTCRDREECAPSFFCALPTETRRELRSIKVDHIYARGATLFVEGQRAEGVYLLCEGRVKLTTYSEAGKAIILRIAEPGELIGLSEIIAGLSYEKTAEASEDCRTSFIKTKDFLNFIKTHHEASLNAMRQLSSNNHKAYLQICSLGLSVSVGDKLARLLLQWCDSRSANGGPVHIERTHTHSDIGEMIGASRETVTRLLNDFRDRGLIKLSRTEVCIPDRKQLKAAIGTKHRNGNGDV
jgi:CRP/FNR family transcriptional regulator, cyclic AMP receptor protein